MSHSNATLPAQDPVQATAVPTSSSGGVQSGNLSCCFKIVMLYRTVRPGSPAQALLPCSISLQRGTHHLEQLISCTVPGQAKCSSTCPAACSCTLTRGAHRRPKHLLPAGDSWNESYLHAQRQARKSFCLLKTPHGKLGLVCSPCLPTGKPLHMCCQPPGGTLSIRQPPKTEGLP